MKLRLTLIAMLLSLTLGAQFKTPPAKATHTGPKNEVTHLPLNVPPRLLPSTGTTSPQKLDLSRTQKLNLQLRQPFSEPLLVRDEQSQLPIYIEGQVQGLPELRDAPKGQRGIQYLNYFKRDMQIKDPAEEFALVGQVTDDQGQIHWRFRQRYQGLEVYGGEVLLHEKDGAIHLLTGRYFPSPQLASTTPSVQAGVALDRVWADLNHKTKVHSLSPAEVEMVGAQVAQQQLVIYHVGEGAARRPYLCWYFEVVPSIHGRWAYFVDAQRGTILRSYSLLCNFLHRKSTNPTARAHFHGHQSIEAEQQAMELMDGKATAVARDLAGRDQTINTYQVGNFYYLIDASRDMFNPAASVFPQDLKGAIVTLDLRNKLNADVFFVTSPDNRWAAANAVSAHYNAGVVYQYYRATFGRKSINGNGGNMRSYINVPEEDGSSMENAYWNGEAMFYGNGGSALRSLARSLDVAGHEITHGVIQNTANLIYEGESGALNESYADIFASMIDRDDWKIGEDVVLPAAFPSGALRDMANPNNGGRSLNDPGWQPAHYSERYTGKEDEGGVHINSGIVNRAFYLFATQVGKEMAEQVYYSALSNYLTRSSQFVDARLAVVRAARERGGESVAKAAESAFETVGIRVGVPTAPPSDVKVNPGTQFILGVRSDQNAIGIFDVNKNTILDLPTPTGVLRKPSISDDGSTILYINKRKELKYLELNWAKASFDTGTISSSRIWENVALSRDGLRLAALIKDRGDEIAVVDLTRETNNTKYFQLYNPTYTQGVSSGNVVGADAIEWDLSSESVVYDAYNEVPLSGFGTYSYWDMGVLNAWDRQNKTFGDGKIGKLFNALEEGENIGNPSFSKNTPYILSFDYIVDQNGNEQVDDADDYFVLSTNLETGDIFTVYKNSTLGFPNYSTKDDFMLFNAKSNLGNELIAIAPLKSDKLSASAGPSIFKSGYIWGTWFANGQRVISSTRAETWPEAQAQVFPNPFRDQLTLELTLTETQELQIALCDVLGRVLQQQHINASAGRFRQVLNLVDLPAGAYVLKVRAGQKGISLKVMK